MIDVPPHIREQILRELRKIDPNLPHLHIDSQAARHGAIALMGTLGEAWGLRPDGSFWKFDDEFDMPLTSLEPEREIQALVWGCERFSWLSELLPPRPTNAKECIPCEGTGWLIPSNVVMVNARGFICEQCQGLGWRDSALDGHASVGRKWWQLWKRPQR